MEQTLVFLVKISITSSIAVLYATLGEILTERSGVLNLGLEGMMLMGAMTAVGVSIATGSAWAGVGAAMLVSGCFALIHAFFAISLRVNQVVSGLALVLFGIGLTDFLGRHLIGKVPPVLHPATVPVLSKIPILGPILFEQVPLVYPAYLMVPAYFFFVNRTRPGLRLRAVGENPEAADAVGIPVEGLRYLYTFIGGLHAGLAGAYLSLAYAPGWKEQMTGGQGWIAIALVIFAIWDPVKAALGALLFGLINALQFYSQAAGIQWLPSYILRMLPYLFTIAVLILITRLEGLRHKVEAPSALGQPFEREG